MAKNWTRISTINDMPSSKKNSKMADRNAKKLIHNTKKLSYEDLLKETLDNYDKKKAKEVFLIDGYNEKRLKSKELIKKAHRMKIQNEKNADKA